jgi:peptide/nickel transport system permease protein
VRAPVGASGWHWPALLSLACWVVLAGLAALGLLPLTDPDAIHLERLFALPEPSAWLGRDELGRPLLARLIHGAGVSLQITLVAVPLAALLGIALGVSAAWTGGVWRSAVGLLVDVMLAFPGLLAAIALAAALGPGLSTVTIALVATGWVGYARLALVLGEGIKRREHVLAGRVLGCSSFTLVWRHVLPLLSGPLLVEACTSLAGAFTGEASLSFLGLGVQPPQASWGGMIRTGSSYLLTAPHLLVLPAVALAGVVLALNALADSLRARGGSPP